MAHEAFMTIRPYVCQQRPVARLRVGACRRHAQRNFVQARVVSGVLRKEVF